jgi:ABC-type phosphate transport system substrate-binding protein
MLSVLAFVLMVGVSAADAPFQVIVHRTNPVASISRAELSAIYMKRVRSWTDGMEIVAVEQPARSRVRGEFSRVVHGKSVAFVTRYWQRVIFAGRGVPPAELKSNEAVIDFVRARRGAIGYIDAGTKPGDDVKVIAVTP